MQILLQVMVSSMASKQQIRAALGKEVYSRKHLLKIMLALQWLDIAGLEPFRGNDNQQGLLSLFGANRGLISMPLSTRYAVRMTGISWLG